MLRAFSCPRWASRGGVRPVQISMIARRLEREQTSFGWVRERIEQLLQQD